MKECRKVDRIGYIMMIDGVWALTDGLLVSIIDWTKWSGDQSKCYYHQFIKGKFTLVWFNLYLYINQ